MQRVVIPIEAIEQRLALGRLFGVAHIGLAVWRGVGHCLGTLGTAPAALSDRKALADDARVDFVCGGVDEAVLEFGYGAGFALVVYAEDFAAELEGAVVGGGGDGFEEGDCALAVDDAAGVELGDAGDGGAGEGARVEVDDFLVGVFEGEDYGVGGEGLEGGVELVEELELVVFDADGVGEEEEVAFEPCDRGGGEFEADGGSHCGWNRGDWSCGEVLGELCGRVIGC